MKVRDVLADVIPGAGMAVRAAASALESTLLSHTPPGEGVYIAPDGTLMRLEPCHSDPDMTRLVPIDEATDD